MEKVSIIGSGNVGANTAFFIAEKGITNVFIYDIQEGIQKGKALDMMEAAPVRKYRNRVIGIDDMGEIRDSESVVIAAGNACSVGGKPEDMLSGNWKTVREIVEKAVRLAPDAVLIVASEPVDLLVTMIARTFSTPRNRLLGLGGILDATRLKAAVARELSISAEDVTAMVIGRHSGDMIVPAEYVRVSGVPVGALLPEDAVRRLGAETAEAGALMSLLAECPGTYYTPSAAAAEVIDSIHMDLKRVLPLSVMLEGEYGIKDAALSLPCVIGKGGVENVLTPELGETQVKELRKSAEAIKKVLKSGLQ